MVTRELTEAARCAKEVRKILKVEFKTTKFSVTSDNFSMGDSVNVSWTDGPTRDEVEGKIKHFQYGHFDGMIDLYEYSNRREDIPQTKYLMCNRHLSEEVVRKCAEKYKKEWGLDEPTEDLGHSFYHNDQYNNWYQIAWKELFEVNLEGGYN